MIKCISGNMVLKYTQFKNGIEEGQRFPVYLFEGEDAFFRERGLFLLKSKLVSEPDLNLVSLDADCSFNELSTSLLSFPFLSEYRMTVLREFYPKQDFLKTGLKSYLENPSSNSLLVILNEKPCEPLKKFESVCVVDCSKADVGLLVRWVKAECAREGVEIELETAKVLCEYCLSDMTRIETETKKLCAYALKEGVINRADVDEMVNRDTEYKIYEMTDYIARKKFDLAFNVIRDMMSKGETSQRILLSVYNYYRRLLHSAISGKSAAELAEFFGVKEFAARKTKEQSAMFKKRSLKSAVDTLTDADYLVKSGKSDADERFWLTIFKLMTEK